MVDYLAEVAQAIDAYLVQPLARPGEVAPYNWVNTLVFAAVALLAAWLMLKLLRKLRVPVDGRFFSAVLPFVAFGAALRVVVDAGLLPRAVVLEGVTLYPFVTPAIYVLTFGVLLGALAVAWVKAGGDPSRPVFARYLWLEGSALAVLALLPLIPLMRNFEQVGLILGLALVGLAAFEALERLRRHGVDLLRGPERWLVLGQSLDGAATFVGVGVGVPGQSYVEQHVVGNLVFQWFGGPWAFYLLKVLFALVVVEVLRRELRDDAARETRVYLLLLIAILGLAPGARDLLRIAAGV
jgi:uncharacterized membrane protein